MSTANYSIDKLNVQFCEAKWGGLFRGIQEERGVYLPEITNCISAIFIIFMGSHMLIFWVHPSGLLRLISATFVINGVSSFMYHYTNLTSWSHIDGMSMLFIAWTMLAYIFEEFIQTVEYNNNNNNNNLTENRFTRIIVAIFWCVACGISWWMIAGAPINGKLYGDKIFDIMFIIPLALSISGIFYMIRYYTISRPYYLNNDVEIRARYRFIFGVVGIIVSASSWIITEHLCDQLYFFKMFPGHMLWHIIASWGMSNCLFYVSLFRADDFHMRASINIGSIKLSELCSLRSVIFFIHTSCSLNSACMMCFNVCSNVYFMLFPAFKFHAYRNFVTTTINIDRV